MSSFNDRFKEILKGFPGEIANKVLTLLNNQLVSGFNDPIGLAMISEIFHFEKFILWKMINIFPITEPYTEFCYYNPGKDLKEAEIDLQIAAITINHKLLKSLNTSFNCDSEKISHAFTSAEDIRTEIIQDIIGELYSHAKGKETLVYKPQKIEDVIHKIKSVDKNASWILFNSGSFHKIAPYIFPSLSNPNWSPSIIGKYGVIEGITIYTVPYPLEDILIGNNHYFSPFVFFPHSLDLRTRVRLFYNMHLFKPNAYSIAKVII